MPSLYKREIINKNNETNLNDIAVDSCAYFIPINAYAEGTCQIAALQYVSYYSHSDCIGYAASILSYDKDDGKLKVIDAKLYTEDELIIKDNQIYGWLKSNTLS